MYISALSAPRWPYAIEKLAKLHVDMVDSSTHDLRQD